MVHSPTDTICTYNLIFLFPTVTPQALFLDFFLKITLGDGLKNSRIRVKPFFLTQVILSFGMTVGPCLIFDFLRACLRATDLEATKGTLVHPAGHYILYQHVSERQRH